MKERTKERKKERKKENNQTNNLSFNSHWKLKELSACLEPALPFQDRWKGCPPSTIPTSSDQQSLLLSSVCLSPSHSTKTISSQLWVSITFFCSLCLTYPPLFDTIDHSILLYKLCHMWHCSVLVSIITQIVSVNDVSSASAASSPCLVLFFSSSFFPHLFCLFFVVVLFCFRLLHLHCSCFSDWILSLAHTS